MDKFHQSIRAVLHAFSRCGIIVERDTKGWRLSGYGVVGVVGLIVLVHLLVSATRGVSHFPW